MLRVHHMLHHMIANDDINGAVSDRIRLADFKDMSLIKVGICVDRVISQCRRYAHKNMMVQSRC